MSLELLLGPQLSAFQAAGYEVVGVSAPGPYVPSIQSRGIEHVPMTSFSRSMSPLRDLRSMRDMYQLFRRRRPDIVHTHNPKPGWFGRPAAKAARVPHIVNTVHGLYAAPNDRLVKRSVVYSLERFAAACSDHELVQNPTDVDTLRRLRIPAARISHLGNGIDLTRFANRPSAQHDRDNLRDDLGISSTDVVIGAVGRLVWEKGYRELFEAFATIRKTHPHAHLVIVGGTDPAKADGIGVADLRHFEDDPAVHFLGERFDVETIYPAFDIYALASYREGFPRSAMEAAAAGLPLIVTDIRGCHEVVEAGVNGLFAAPHSAEALIEPLTQLIARPSDRTRMGAASSTKAINEFDQNTQITKTLAIYQELLST